MPSENSYAVVRGWIRMFPSGNVTGVPCGKISRTLRERITEIKSEEEMKKGEGMRDVSAVDSCPRLFPIVTLGATVSPTDTSQKDGGLPLVTSERASLRS